MTTNQYIIFPRTSHSRAGRPCRKINICNQSAAERLNTTKSTRKKQSQVCLPCICLSFSFWLRLAGKVCCWHYTIGLDGKLQNRSRSLYLYSVAHAAEHRRARKVTRMPGFECSLSQMFPFQRRAAYLVFRICDFEFLNATGISCFGECQNVPEIKFVAWKQESISDAQSHIVEWSESPAFLKDFKY